MTYDPSNPPSAAEFLDPSRWPPETEEDGPEVTFQGTPLSIGAGRVWQLPPDPLERIAVAIEALARSRPINVYESPSAAETAAEVARLSELMGERSALQHAVGERAEKHLTPVDDGMTQVYTEELADLEAKYGVLLQVIADVEEALGKSKAAPALAAKAVIEAWKNPTVPEDPDEVVEPMSDEQYADLNGEPESDAEEQAEAAEEALKKVEPEVYEDKVGPVELAPGGPVVESIEGHTRAEHEEQADYIFCRECTLEQQVWVTWPCPSVASARLSELPDSTVIKDKVEKTEEPEPVQPEHNAPVEEWREFARAKGLAGPNIDRANRSQIRTALGIAHEG